MDAPRRRAAPPRRRGLRHQGAGRRFPAAGARRRLRERFGRGGARGGDARGGAARRAIRLWRRARARGAARPRGPAPPWCGGRGGGLHARGAGPPQQVERVHHASITRPSRVHHARSCLGRSTVPAQRATALRALARVWSVHSSGRLAASVRRWSRDADAAVSPPAPHRPVHDTSTTRPRHGH